MPFCMIKDKTNKELLWKTPTHDGLKDEFLRIKRKMNEVRCIVSLFTIWPSIGFSMIYGLYLINSPMTKAADGFSFGESTFFYFFWTKFVRKLN